MDEYNFLLQQNAIIFLIQPFVCYIVYFIRSLIII
jgi:hypothetical protein